MSTFRDPKTGRVLGAPDGSELERRLDENRWERVGSDTVEETDAPAEAESPRDPRLAKSRDEINQMGTDAGVENPEGMSNKQAVLAAIDALGGDAGAS